MIGKLLGQTRAQTAIADHRVSVSETLKGFSDVGSAMLDAHAANGSVTRAVNHAVGWESFARLVANAQALTRVLVSA